MIVKRTNEKVFYPKRKIGDLVLSLEYKYSECHSDNETYYYQSKHSFTREVELDFYFEARNWKTNLVEACILGYETRYEGVFKYYQMTSMIVDKLSFNNPKSLIKLLYYIESTYSVFINSNLVITDLDDTLRNLFKDSIIFYDLHNKYNQKHIYTSDDAFDLKIFGVALSSCDYEYEDERKIFVEKDFDIKNTGFADDVFLIQAENESWPIPVYSYLDEEDDNLAYFNDEPPIAIVGFNEIYYKKKLVGYVIYDNGIDYIDNQYVPITFIYDMYIDVKDDLKYKVLDYILNCIKYSYYRWLAMYLVVYKLNDGKDVLCNCLIDKYNAIDDGNRVYIKYEQK